MALEDYNWADRVVHKLAFGAEAPQALLCDLETKRYGEAIRAQPISAPIFITALPRAGTTLLLELLARHPSLVSHTYRDMPFVLSPILWRRLSGKFQVKQAAKERSHKDGLYITVDSPEAFEEVLWLKHFPDHYRAFGIEPWKSLPEAFIAALRTHMKSLIVSRSETVGPSSRYISKNNANIARLAPLITAFPGARVIVPLRHPLDHARSLLKQHNRALQSHAQSRFTRDYTADIGHFEFGETHRPILFDGMAKTIATREPLQLDYWLAYWIAAMHHVEQQCVAEFVDMERFTSAPDIPGLFARLDLPEAGEAVADGAAMIRPIARYEDGGDVNAALLDEAMTVYRRLRNSDACLV